MLAVAAQLASKGHLNKDNLKVLILRSFYVNLKSIFKNEFRSYCEDCLMFLKILFKFT